MEWVVKQVTDGKSGRRKRSSCDHPELQITSPTDPSEVDRDTTAETAQAEGESPRNQDTYQKIQSVANGQIQIRHNTSNNGDLDKIMVTDYIERNFDVHEFLKLKEIIEEVEQRKY